MCHAPIVIPAIGGRRASECIRTTEAMRRVARHVVATSDLLVLLSPHAPRRPSSFGISEGDVQLSFARFGAPHVAPRLTGSLELARGLSDAAREAGVETHTLEPDPDDHGAAVPAFFLAEAGYRGRAVLVSLPYSDTHAEARFGAAIARAAASTEQRLAVVASGDLSHRLMPGAPAGYDPRAQEFDETFVGRLSSGELRSACQTDRSLRYLAAEDAVDSTTVAAAAVGYDARGHELLAYEGPFGVGYAEAILHHRAAPPQTLSTIARSAIAALLEGRDYDPPALDAPWDAPFGAFVTLREPDGQLRGCVGRTHPSEPTLAREVKSAAESAAMHDPRFPPVSLWDLPNLSIEVSVLEPPEPVSGLADLDPARYGVLVSAQSRRGVLLPNVPGVDSAAEQVRIARHKADIAEGVRVRLERFVVHKVSGAEG
jgi:AmmeMemoRadiSam system protein A